MESGWIMSNINDYLNQRQEELMVYKMPRNEALMDEIFAFDPRNLESTSAADVSKYTIGIAQFLIFFSSQINNTRMKLIQKNRVIDTYINQSDIKAKTKAEKRYKVIAASPELKQIEIDIEALEAEVKMTDNLEKYYIELINAFKRELTRRDTERRFSRDERRL
jgi:predicted component of type VI protein secretion system